MKCRDIMAHLEQLSPKSYACDWDNVGLLIGRKDKEVRKIMVALDASCDVVKQAVENRVDMLITHHPMIFSALKQMNEDNFIAEKALTLAENGICYYAMHTNFDTVGGMAELAVGEQFLNLTETSPIEEGEEKGVGLGRYGVLPNPMTAKEVCAYVKEKFQIPFVLLYQSERQKDKVYERIAVMPGSGKSEKKLVVQNGYDLYLTGDFGHHDGLDAIDMGLTVIDATHYGLEHIFIAYIGDFLKHICEDIDVILIDNGSPVQVQ